MFCEVGLLAIGCCALLDLLPCNEAAFSHLTQAATVYESTRKHQPHHSSLPSIYKRSWSLTFSSVEGLKACERFLIGVIRPKRYHEIAVNGDICLVARSLLSVCTILSTQRSQGPPTRAQLQNGQTNLPDEHRALLFPNCCHGLESMCLIVWERRLECSQNMLLEVSPDPGTDKRRFPLFSVTWAHNFVSLFPFRGPHKAVMPAWPISTMLCF